MKQLSLIQEYYEKSNADMAQMLAIKVSEYSGILSDKKEMSAKQTAIIMKNFGVSLDYLLDGVVENDTDRLILRHYENKHALEEDLAFKKKLLRLMKSKKLDEHIETIYKCFCSDGKNAIRPSDMRCSLYMLLSLKNIELFKFVYENYGFVFNGKITENSSADEQEAEIQKEVFLTFQEPKDRLFFFNYFKVLYNASEHLTAFGNGKEKWNSRIVLKLIESGGVVSLKSPLNYREPFSPNYIGELPIYLTKLVKDYCERHLDE